MFVTCSDDTNVCVWDVRNLGQQVHVLTAHSNWVKNIEYAHHSRHLLTSGFDGSVYLWDLNR
jgi:WD40 repeat protein